MATLWYSSPMLKYYRFINYFVLVGDCPRHARMHLSWGNFQTSQIRGFASDGQNIKMFMLKKKKTH